MAETLSAEEKFLKSVSKVKITDRPIFKASMSKFRELGIEFSYLVGRNAEKERVRLVAERATILPTLNAELKNLILISDDRVWGDLSNKDQESIIALVKDVQALSGIDIGVDSIKDNMKAVLSKCMEVVERVGEQMKTLSSLGTFSQDNLTSVIGQLDKGVIEHSSILIPSKEDLDIVTALKMTGIDLQFNSGKWELNASAPGASAVSFVPTKDGKPLQVFGNENIQFLLNNYLNVPHSQRQQTVVPDKLLKVFTNEYERQLGGDGKSSLEKSVIEVEVAKQRKIFSVDSDEFRITKLLDRDTIMRNAQNMALVGAFEEIVKGAKDTTEISEEISGIIGSISSDPAYKGITKSLGKLVPMLERAGNSFEDATEFVGGQDFVAEYDRQIEYFKRTNASDEYVQALVSAKSEFIQTVAVQQAFWQNRLPAIAQKGDGNIFGDELATTINESMGFAVMQNEGGFVMANGQTVKQFLEEKGIPSEAYLKIVDRLQNKQATAGATQADKPGATVPDIFGDYCELFGGDNIVQILGDYANLQFYQFLWQSKFDIEFQNFQKQNGEKGTLDAFIEQLRATNPIFDANGVEEAYYLLHPEAAKDKPEVLKRAEGKINAFDKHILLTDLMIKSFTPGELVQFETMPENVKEVFLNTKFKDAEKAFALLEENPVKFKETLERAKKRHEPHIVGSTIAQLWQGAPEADAEAGKGPIVTTAVKNFLKEQNDKRKKNNAELAAQGEPVVAIPENPDAEKEKEGKTEEDKKPTTFGDVFPSGPNTNKFLKKMKPYHAKEITKHFIEPLLEALDGIVINMDAYYAKVNAASGLDYDMTAPQGEPQLTEEQQKAFEEQLKQQEQNLIAVKQRDFEASAFIPAAIMFDRVRGGAKGKPEYEHADKLRNVFRYLATTGEIDVSAKLGVKTPEGKDVRDDLRTLALQICGGGFKGKGAEGVQQVLAPILTKYGVDPAIQEEIKDAFMFMTPELLAIALEPVSVVRDNKLEIGAKIPSHMMNATNDRERWTSLQVRGFNMAEHEGTIENLSALVGTIYRTMDGSQIDKKDIDRSFEVKLEHESAEFNQVKDTEQMKFLIKQMREQAGMSAPQGAEAESEMADDGGM